MIEESKALSVTDALRTVPGVEINQSGGLGSTSTIFIRGTKTEHALVMLDGMVLNDAVSTGKIFDFAHLPIDGVERIEIVKGAQSTLYGSEAIGGVINIITKKGTEGQKLSLNTEAGSFDTFKQNISFGGKNKNGDFYISATHLNSSSVSVANSDLEGNTEDDDYKNTTAVTKANINASEKVTITLNGRISDFEKDIDNGNGSFADDLNQLNEGTEYQIGTTLNYKDKDAKLSSRLSFYYSVKDWEDNDPDTSDFLHSTFLGKIASTEWQTTKEIKNHKLTAGIGYSEDKGEFSYFSNGMFGPFTDAMTEQGSQTASIYLQNQMSFAEKIFPVIGIRYDDHSMFGEETTYKAAIAYLIESTQTKLKTSYGTGFKAPSVYQLYSSYGNTNLKAEKSKSFDIGFEQSLCKDKINTEIVYFHNDIEDMIDYDFASYSYENIAEAKTSGVEFSLKAKITDKLNASVNYTYTDTEDQYGKELLRRAKNKANLSLNYRHCEKLSLNFFAKYVDDRKDITFVGFESVTVTNPSYIVCDINADYKVNDIFSFYAKITNIFDEKYEDVYGYGTEGVGYFAGCKISL